MAARGGFTLIEVMVASVMAAVLLSALAFGFNAALRAQARISLRMDEDAEVRLVFGQMRRDLGAAFVSTNNPISQFVTGAGSSASTSSASATSSGTALLTLTSLTHRLAALSANSNGPGVPGALGATTAPGASNDLSQRATPPQSDQALIRYVLDAGSGDLSRIETPLPTTTPLGALPNSSGVMGRNVQSLQFQFWDTDQQTYRSDWDWEYQPPADPTPGATASTTLSASTDKKLPTAVQITLVLRRAGGEVATYETTVSVAGPDAFTSADPASVGATSSGTSDAGPGSDSTGGSSGTSGTGGSNTPTSGVRPGLGTSGARPGMGGIGRPGLGGGSP